PVPTAAASGAGRNRDLAVDDLLLVLVEGGLDVVDVAAGGGVVDATGLQVVDDGAGLHGAGGGVLDEVVDRDVDLLQHRRDDDVLDLRVRGEGRLVGVDADRHGAGRLGRLEHAAAGAAGRLVDHVGARVVHALGDGLALRRVVEAGEVRRLGQVLALDLDVRLDGLRARDVAGLELLDQRGLDAADEADVAHLGLERRDRADEERTLLLGEDEVGD